MTVSELAQVAGVEVEEVVAVVVGDARTPKTATAARSGRGRSRTHGRRTTKSRVDAYTAKVRDVVLGAKAPVSSVEIRAKVGGDAGRCRAALGRLIESGLVRHDGGATRSRRYLSARGAT